MFKEDSIIWSGGLERAAGWVKDSSWIADLKVEVFGNVTRECQAHVYFCCTFRNCSLLSD